MTLYPPGRILSAVRAITLIGLVFAASMARADNASDATKLFEEAVALKESGKYAEACAKFAKSFEADQLAGRPAPGTQLNLGECAEREGQLRKAYVLFDDAEKDYGRRANASEASLTKDPSSAELKRDLERAQAGMRVARERADALAPRLAKIVVRIAEPAIDGMSIRVGDRALPPAAEVIEYLDGGNVTITATAPNREPFTASAKAESGKQVVVDVPALKVIGGAKPSEPGPVGPRRQRKRVLIAAGVGGGGVLFLGLSTIIGLGAKSDYDKAAANCPSVDGKRVCTNDVDRAAINKAFDKADTATIFGIGGLALAAAGAVIYFTAPKEGLDVTPMATSSSAGISLSGRF